MPEKKVLIVLVILTVASVLASFVTVSQGDYLSILHALSVGFFGSSIFYFFVVYIPERSKRKRVRIRLQYQYRTIKLDCIELMLMLSNSQPYRCREKLLDLKEFRKFFNELVEPHKPRWYAFASGLEENEYHLRELLYYLRMLNDEIRDAMTTIDIHDEEVIRFMKNCSHVLSRLDMIQPDYDDIKLLCRNLWSLFTGFDHVTGQRETDIIQDMIDKIK